jgi:lincosamide nucleotidyltransferase A/C/D/E
MMTESDALDLLRQAAAHDIEVWLDGGWGVDALVGRQTRVHEDIDLFIRRKDAAALTALLRREGYRETPAEYTTEGHTKWCAADGRTVDLHRFEFIGAETLRFEGESYPASLLDGTGTIGSLPVRCLTAEAQLLYHQGYEHDENDAADVRLLCETFGLPVPEEYQ